MKRFFKLGVVAVTVLFASCAKDTTLGVGDVNEADKTFAATAGELYLVHRNFSEVAFRNGADSAVIRLAEKIFLTGNNGFNDLIDLCQRVDLSVPGNLTAEHEALKTQLSQLSGRALDSTYLHVLFQEQHQLLEAYDALVLNGNNLTIRDHGKRYADTMQVYHVQVDTLSGQF
jgi:predicted outer membrane protein